MGWVWTNANFVLRTSILKDYFLILGWGGRGWGGYGWGGYGGKLAFSKRILFHKVVKGSFIILFLLVSHFNF